MSIRETCSCGVAWADEPGHDHDTENAHMAAIGDWTVDEQGRKVGPAVDTPPSFAKQWEAGA